MMACPVFVFFCLVLICGPIHRPNRLKLNEITDIFSSLCLNALLKACCGRSTDVNITLRCLTWHLCGDLVLYGSF